ncbi:MAG: nitroreductase family protein [Candidatus Limiplasma sp.]|nr:nitroreductase family protein [Candidatus Limiplasma sp.]
MPGPWTLNGFYDAMEMTGLYEAISLRESCRSFASAPAAEVWNSLQCCAQACALPGTRIALGLCDTSLFQPLGGFGMKFENVRCFAAVIVGENTPENVVNAGIGGEMVMLSAVEQGLGGVWVSGTYKRSKVPLSLEPGEKIKALMALGVPDLPPKPPLARKRKALELLCEPGFDKAPSPFREAALVVRAAPSAMNLQPWRMRYGPEENTMTLSVKQSFQRLDLGIAVSHVLLALGKTPASFALSENGLSATVTLE